MPAPSINEILASVPPGSDGLRVWVGANGSNLAGGRGPNEPLALDTLLGFATGFPVGEIDEEGYDELFEWAAAAQAWAVGRLLATEGIDGRAWCRAAVTHAWRLWAPAVEAAGDHDAAVVGGVVAVATDPAASGDELRAALATGRGLPSRTSPPPWVGHFYATLEELIEARLATGEDRTRHVGRCLDRSCVTPAGGHAAGAVAAVLAPGGS